MRWVLLGAAALAVALVAWVLFASREVEEPPPEGPSPPTLRAPPAVTATTARPSLVPSRLPHEVERVPAPPPEAPPPPAERPEVSALVGLEVETLSSADRERLRVPKGYGTGVRIVRVEPDSPAAEVGLRPDDVIVRAQRTDVQLPRDLEAAVGGRDHTLLNVARGGQLMQAVLKAPYVAP